jgi:hypothetical protein
MPRPLATPNNCFLKNVEQGTSGLYVALNTNMRPVNDSARIKKKLVQSKFLI